MASGLYISSSSNDRRTGQECPKCSSEVVYNGNYFCSECEWAMPEHYKDGLRFLIGLRDIALEYGDTSYADHCDYYIGLEEAKNDG